MPKPSSAGFTPVGGFVLQQTSSQAALLRSANAVAEASALAEDLFRLRVVRGGRLPDRPSWAVAKTDWPGIPVLIKASKSTVTVRTPRGGLSFRLGDGAWQLSDQAGAGIPRTNSRLAPLNLGGDGPSPQPQWGRPVPAPRFVFAAASAQMGFAGPRPQLALTLAEGECLFGLGETTGSFNKRGLTREFWNSDALAHASAIHPGLQRLYVSIPFAISLREGRAAGLFWDNPARQTWDLGQRQRDRWQLTAASGEIDLYLFLGPTVSEVVARFTELTGHMPLPPQWALGYHQSRYSYATRRRVEEIARQFRRRRIPCDALYLDIDHMDGYRVFTFGKAFPQPAQMLAKLARRGFKVVAIVDPGVKDDPQFGVLKRGRAQNAFVKAQDGRQDFIGKVWPGKVRFPDFLNGHVRAWWSGEQSRLLKLGVAGIWNDMNEPANFGHPTKTLPDNCRHHTDDGPARHSEVHNLYGLAMARASRRGCLVHRPEARPFVITRAGYAGVQRYALVWTGDNSSAWEHLADSVQMLLNLGVSGLAFCGSDVGGFLDHCTPELLARWTQMAAFTPFFRNHSNRGTVDQEPWAFGPETEAICRRYIELRYQLLPYLYGLFVEAHGRGTPIMRPMFWHYQDDPVAVATGDQFLLGSDLLVAPILRQGSVARSVYLPAGVWFNFWTGERLVGPQHIVAHAPLDTLPLFVRGGAVIPMAPLQQYAGQRPLDTINLHLWPGTPCVLPWYEDDGNSLAYEYGGFHERDLVCSSGLLRGSLQFRPASGKFPSAVKRWRVLLRAASHRYRIKINGGTVQGRFNPTTAVCAFEFPNTAAAIDVQWG
jgi:alpha-glucosidase